MMTGTQVIGGRYEIKDPPIGQGGMGVVFKAYDNVTKRFVALKTMYGVVDPNAIDMFEREWTVLARVSHPNIVDILDTGEFKEGEQRRPYFVMPLLPGTTLDRLIKASSQRLTVDRSVEIITQACRGLQAAHDHGLVHRDIKPSNIFVMDDDTVKIIDFGVVHLADTRSVTGIKGTLQYMAPEQLDMKPSTPLSDMFSLAVVSYETLTGRKPFGRSSDADVVEAIRTHIPPPVSDVKPSINQMVGRTIHKAMAKQPWHRFANAREFAETLQKALRNESIERFDRSKIQPRIDRIKRAFSEGDFQFATEILTELESEGHIDPDMSLLRVQIDQAVRQKKTRQLIESAKTRLEEEEYPLALQKVHEVLEIDPDNAEALGIRAQIERQRSEKQVDNWYRLVRQHLSNQFFSQAREGVQEILKLAPSDPRAREMLLEIDRTEREFVKVREEKQKLYESALNYYQSGEISTALSKLERVLDLSHRAAKTGTPDQDAQYQSLYNQIRSERDAARSAYTEGRKHLADRNFKRALEICEEHLQKHSGDPMFQALKLETEEAQRQEQSAAINEVGRRVDAEADLEKKVNILRDAVERYPNEQHFKQSLKLIRDRRDLVNSIVAKARQYEERQQFNEAISQWDILRNIYAPYPGLDFELQRLSRRREEQAKEEGKARWVERIDRHLANGEYGRAHELTNDALGEFPDDRELIGLAKLAEQGAKRGEEAAVLLQEGHRLAAEGKVQEGIDALRKAEQLDDRNPVIRAALRNALLEHARALMPKNWRAAETFVDQSLTMDSNDPAARSLAALLHDYKRQEAVNQFVLEAREYQAKGELNAAIASVEKGLAVYPNDFRLSQLHGTLRSAVAEQRRPDVYRRAAEPPPAPPASPDPVFSPHEETVLEHRAAEPISSETMLQVELPPPGDNEPPSPATFVVPPVTAVAAPNTAATTEVPQLAVPPGAAPPAFPPALPPPPPAPPVKPPAPPLAPPTKPAPLTGKKTPLVWMILAGAVLLIAAALIYSKFRSPGAPPPAPGQTAVQLTANVPGAKFAVDGQPVAGAALNLSPGTHRAEASLDGYRPDARTFVVPAGGSSPFKVEFNLAVALPTLRVTSGLTSGKFVLDNDPPVEMQEGGFSKTDVPVGDHTLKILDGAREVFSFVFKVQPKELAPLTGPLQSKDLPGVVISTLGGAAKVYASTSLKGNISGQPFQVIPAEGLEIKDVSPGNSDFVVDDGKTQRHLVLETSNVPILNVVLFSAKDIGTMVVKANVPDAIVVIEGVPLKRPLSNGSRIVSLEPRIYKVKVTHADFQDSAEQSVEIKKGELKTVEFTLAPIVLKAILALDGLPPDTEISIDGNRRGAIGPTGSLNLEVAPGSHTILLHKQGFEDASLSRDFKADQTIHIASDVFKAFGQLAFKVSPPSARITYRRSGDTQSHDATNGQSVALPAGDYEISAQADQFSTRTQTINLAPGKTVTVELTLAKAEAGAAPTHATVQPPKLLAGGGFSVFLPATAPGQYGFAMRLQKGGVFSKKMQWYAGYVDEKNFVAFEIDGKHAGIRQVTAGKSSELKKVAVSLDMKSWVEVEMTVTGSSVEVRYRQEGGTWAILTGPLPVGEDGFNQGKMGFYVPGNDVMAVANFRFSPR